MGGFKPPFFYSDTLEESIPKKKSILLGMDSSTKRDMGV